MKKVFVMVMIIVAMTMAIKPACATVLKEDTVITEIVRKEFDNHRTEITTVHHTRTYKSERTGDEVTIEFTKEEDVETTFTMGSVRVWDENSNEYMMDFYEIKYTNVATNVEDVLEVSFDEYIEERSRNDKRSDDEWYEKVWNFVSFWD